MFESKAHLIAVITLLLLSSCGSKKNDNGSQSNAVNVKTIFVKGDPLNLIAGSTPQPESVLNTAEIDEHNQFALAGITQFTEKEEVVEREDSTNIEAGNEAQENDQTSKKPILFSFKKTGNEYLFSSENVGLEFSFADVAGKLKIVSLQTSSGAYNLSAIHYSLNKTKDAFSILVSTNDLEEGNVLLSLTFTKKSVQQEIKKVSTYYKFIYGAGVALGWDQKETIEVDICGAPSAKVENVYRRGIEQWAGPLRGRLNIVTKTLGTYPPFSDLNNHCIYTVKNYQTVYDEEIMNSGTTYSSADLNKGKLIDSDVMIWEKEILKSGLSLEQKASLQRSLAHEFGHLLGLDHQFSQFVPSIMGYSGYTEISNYDVIAVALLYPTI